MKTLLLTTKSQLHDIELFGKELLETIKQSSETIIYDTVQPDFSNISELKDDSEKLVLFSQFSVAGGFSTLTNYLPTFKNIRFLLSPYSSFQGLDLEIVKKLDIKYRNNAGANAKSVAQYAIASMFLLLSKFPLLAKQNTMPDGSILGEEYHTKTAGILGMGNVGEELLPILTGLHIPTVYYNRTDKNVAAERVSLLELFNRDLIFITIATNPQTIELLKDLPSLIQKQNYIIDSTAIDSLYDKRKVTQMLEEEKFQGYALESFDGKTMPLTSTKNFSITPHIAWCTVDAERRTVVHYLTRALKIINGEANTIDFLV